MERLGLIGVSWRTVDGEMLEQLTLPTETREFELARIREQTGVSEMVYLSTCNRVEILFADDGRTPASEYRARFFEALLGRAPQAGEAERLFRAWGGEGAVEHLLLVAAGLDSAQLGEHEIRGQLRSAHDLARRTGLSGRRLDFVVERAIRVARDVQQQTGLMDGRVSIAEVGLAAVRERLIDRPGPVALVGVSAMTKRCGEQLQKAGVGLLVINRTPERAEELAERLKADWRPLNDFQSRPDAVTAVILAAGASEPVLRRETLAQLQRSGDPPLLVDFGVPSNVEVAAAQDLGLPYLGMNAISRRAEQSRDLRRREAVQARQLVDEALVQVRRQMAERTLAPVLSKIGARYRQTADQGVARLFRRELKHLGPEDRQAVERFAHNLAKRLAHLPSVGLRALAPDFGVEAVETFLQAADETLAQELQDAVSRDDVFSVSIVEEGG